MRLLQIKEGGNFSLVEHVRDIPDYAILSHTWGADEDEVTFRDLVDGTGKTKAGYRKIHFCGKQAAKDKLDYFWVDTCCIDKSSSAELSEAINSMFRWYYNAAKCYVYLSDVSIGDSVGNDPSFQQKWKSAFQHSRWFTRGWTLQELIAPTCVEFFSVECERLGDKGSMVQEIHEITGISVRALQGSPLPQLGVGERMSWAERRETKREEDAAYSLLGIFDVHMPLIYGEGKRKAFERLKKEINQLLWDESSALPSSLYLKNEESSPTPSSSIPFRREPGFMDRGTPLDQIRKKDSVAESLVSIHAQSRPSESSFPEFFQKKKWDHEFLQDRGPNEQESYAEFMRSYAKSLGLNPPVNHVTSILQEYEDTSIPACEVDEIATFCKGVRLRDLTMHNPNQRKGAWIDDRMYSSYHPGQVTQGNRSASSELDHAFGTASIEEPLLELVSQPLGASKGTALSSARHHLPFREYGGFQTAAALFGHLKQKRFGHAEMPNADRRLIYIQDLSPEYALALLETATWHQIPVLTDALWKHLALQTSMRINVPPRGYKIFQLDFHMPFYALRAGWPKDSYQNGTLVKPPRSWFDMTFLASRKQKPVKETVWGIHEAQISFVICGPAERRWTAYAFVDTDFDTDFDEDEMSGDDFDYSSIIEDPIAPDGDLNANHPIWNPREYYLVIVRARLGKVLSEWKQLVRMIEMGVREYTHIHPSLSKAIEAKESVIENLEWTLRTLHILRTLIGCLSKTNDIWYRFAGFDGDIAYLSDLGSASCKSREYIQGYLREIKEIFQELGNLKRRLSDVEQQCNTSKEILQLRLTVESNNTTQLGKYTSESVLSMFRNILGGVGGSERQRN